MRQTPIKEPISMSKQDYLYLLSQHLDPNALATLRDLVARRKSPPFEYDAKTGRLEPALDDIDPDNLDDTGLDVVFTACDILNQHAAQLDPQSLPGTVRPDSGISEHTFDFTTEDPQYTTFMKLLQSMIKASEITVEVQKQQGNIRLLVRLPFYGEHDYHQKKEQLYFLHDLARRKVKDTPYQGSRY
jgi:hypothetical protein